MKLDIPTAKVRYMSAHVKMHSKAAPASYSDLELLEAFNLLPLPDVAFDDWCALCGYELIDPTEEANETAINAIKSDQHPGVHIGKPE